MSGTREAVDPADGLPVDDVGAWSQDKHRLVATYCDIFSTGMKNEWDLAYLDLYSGPGRALVRRTSRVVDTSPLLALRARAPFSRYIFCDRKTKLVDALRTRVERAFPERDVRYHEGDCNKITNELLADLPARGPRRKMLSLAFLDPYNIATLKFATIEALATRRMDFIVLLALKMDAHRNQDQYVSESDTKVEEFLGDADWRDRWASERQHNTPFATFLAHEFARSMERIGYLPEGRTSMKQFADDRGQPIYHIAFFSKDPIGYKFWQQALEYSTAQRTLPL